MSKFYQDKIEWYSEEVLKERLRSRDREFRVASNYQRRTEFDRWQLEADAIEKELEERKRDRNR
tara:strand:+ start:1342 stop:1533 length:192 start_codon:yes stop_codon:yes gene_type:complete